MNFGTNADTICALSTANGMGAIAVVRVSGPLAIAIVNTVFSKNIADAGSHTAHFGVLKDGEQIIDEVLLNVFHQNRSFTGEETVEIACHGFGFYPTSRIAVAYETWLSLGRSWGVHHACLYEW